MKVEGSQTKVQSKGARIGKGKKVWDGKKSAVVERYSRIHCHCSITQWVGIEVQ